MLFMIKFTFYFAISFIILCIPVSQETLFNHIHDYARPYTTQIFNQVENEASKQIQNGSQFTKKFFSNSNPSHQDKVISKFSSTKREPIENVESLINNDNEEYTVEEIELLNKILKEAQ